MPGRPDPTAAELIKVVALDGPAGTGKSTVSRRVAASLGWRFVDTGATYRAATLAVLRAGVDLSDSEAVEAVAVSATIELRTDPGFPGVLLDGEEVSGQIRTGQVSSHVSAVSALPSVRRRLIALQRAAMGTDGAVVEGRDIASVVAPHAAVKVYLDARPEVRARRRADDVMSSQEGAARNQEAVARALEIRDTLDNQTTRLNASDGALHLDTSDMTLDAVVAAVVRLVELAGLTSG